jgi:hypothetical protein
LAVPEPFEQVEIAMHLGWMRRLLVLAALASVMLPQPLQAGQANRRESRAGFDDLIREMSTCAAYFSLLSSIIENSDGPPAKAEVAQQTKSTGQAMLVQAINVANHIGMPDDVVMERVQIALKEMVDTTNADSPNSLQVMHTKYGQPCDELLENAPRRFKDLIGSDREDF